MKKPLFHCGGIIFLLLLSFSSFSQRGKSAILRYDTAARYGKLILADGTELPGRIVFNDNDGIFTLFNGEASQSFNSRSIAQARFFDREAGRDRLFYSLEYTDPQTGLTDTEFFEVLKELDSFVVLVRIDRLKTVARKSLLTPRTSPMLVDRSARQSVQTQTVFFLDEQGNFEPYMNIVEKEVGDDLWDNNVTNTRIINAGLFKKYTDPYFKTLVEYAKENFLSFKRKSEIITILEEYERLSGN